MRKLRAARREYWKRKKRAIRLGEEEEETPKERKPEPKKEKKEKEPELEVLDE
jgi:hypothetical protein